MGTLSFTPAVKSMAKLRLALDGPSGAGKTYTALEVGTALGHRVALIDSERGSAAKYADRFSFDTLPLPSGHPGNYMTGIALAAQAGYDVLIVDSLTHAWNGKEGVLEQVDAAKARFGGNSQRAWAVGTPLWRNLLDALIAYPGHVIVTMRSKTKWVEEEDRGRKSYRRAGTEPEARDGVEYEFDVFADLDLDHRMVVAKTRCPLIGGTVLQPPFTVLADTLRGWLDDGAEAPPPAPAFPPPAAGVEDLPPSPAEDAPPPAAPTELWRSVSAQLGKLTVEQKGELRDWLEQHQADLINEEPKGVTAKKVARAFGEPARAGLWQRFVAVREAMAKADAAPPPVPPEVARRDPDDDPPPAAPPPPPGQEALV